MIDKNSTRKAYYVKEFGPHSDKIIFFFCPFGVSIWSFNLPGMPIWRLRRSGYNVVAYSYDVSIATKSVKFTIDSIELILSDADSRLRAFKRGANISCFGSSMGSLIAFNFAARHANVKKVVLNLSYSDIIDHLLAFPETRTFTKELTNSYLASAGSRSRLKEEFSPYSPINLVDKFRSKKVLLYLCRNDRLLKFQHTSNIRRALKNSGIETEYSENKVGGHTFAVILNSLLYRRYLQFLNRP